MPGYRYYTYGVSGRRYGCLSFLFDCFMTVITGGFWIIWIFVREMRNRRQRWF